MIVAIQSAAVVAPGIQSAVAEVRADRFHLAWEAAVGESRPLERCQAETYVRHHAGDLDGALRSAEQGLREHPDDPWLLASAAEIALALHHGARAAAPISRLQGIPSPAGSPERERLAHWSADLADLEQSEQAVRTGMRRARWINALAGVSILLLLLWLARASSGQQSEPPARS